MPSTRTPIRTQSNAWRQWERLAASGLRLHHHPRRGTAVQALMAWLSLLLLLYLLRALFTERAGDELDAVDGDGDGGDGVGRADGREEGNDSMAGDSDATIDAKIRQHTSLDFWRGRHLIFCLSAGRSGSQYLRNVLDVADDTRAYHEPLPTMTGPVLNSVLLQGLRRDTLVSRSVKKLGAIQVELEGSSRSIAYAETSHMFVKTFADVVLQALGDVANITIIALRRPLARVVLSQLRLGWFAPSHSGRGVWYYDASDVHSRERVLPLAGTANLTNAVDRAIAYNVDVWERTNVLKLQVDRMHAKNRWPNVRVVEADVTQLVSPDSVMRFLHKVGLQADRRRLQVLPSHDANARALKKDRVFVDTTFEEVTRRIEGLSSLLPMVRDAL